MEFPVTRELAIFKKAGQISHDLNHHLFDTLYHAVALVHGGVLVTADERYFLKARRIGSIVRLRSWSKVAESRTPSESGS
jgi:predicted nucleic acid-binding protein